MPGAERPARFTREKLVPAQSNITARALQLDQGGAVFTYRSKGPPLPGTGEAIVTAAAGAGVGPAEGNNAIAGAGGVEINRS